jgi:hypothetical protein
MKESEKLPASANREFADFCANHHALLRIILPVELRGTLCGLHLVPEVRERGCK